MPAITFTAAIHKELTAIKDKLDKLNPDTKHNSGRLIGRCLMWDQIQKYAKKQSEVAWQELEDEDIIKYVDCEGDHSLAESPHFLVQDKVSLPRKAFNGDHLAEALKKKYKVPVPIAKELIEQAKLPGKRVHTTVVVER